MARRNLILANQIIPVYAFNDFHFGTNGQILTTNSVLLSAIGTGAWGTWPANINFQTWSVVSGPDTPLVTKVSVGSTNFTTSGTKWIRCTHGNGNPVESISWQAPGGSGGVFQHMVLRYIARFNATNSTGGLINLDHSLIDGNPFGYFQEQLFGNGNQPAFIAHAGGGNGVFITNNTAKIYQVTQDYNLNISSITVTLHDTADGSLVSQSVGTLSGSGNAYWVRMQANYIEQTPFPLTGFTEFTAMSIFYE